MGKKPPHITSARGTLNLIYCLNHTARQTETNDTFFPWNVVRVCVLRYFSSSTSLAHLYNFAAICCLLKKNKSLSFKIIAGCQSGTVLLPAGRPVFKRILYLAWAGFSICWVRQRLKFFIPPGLYSEKAGTAQYLFTYSEEMEKGFFSVLSGFLSQLRGYTLCNGCLDTSSIPIPLLPLWATKRTVNIAALFREIMFPGCDMKGSKMNTGSCVLQELPIYWWVFFTEFRKTSTAFSEELLTGEMYTCSSFLDTELFKGRKQNSVMNQPDLFLPSI